MLNAPKKKRVTKSRLMFKSKMIWRSLFQNLSLKIRKIQLLNLSALCLTRVMMKRSMALVISECLSITLTRLRNRSNLVQKLEKLKAGSRIIPTFMFPNRILTIQFYAKPRVLMEFPKIITQKIIIAAFVVQDTMKTTVCIDLIAQEIRNSSNLIKSGIDSIMTPFMRKPSMEVAVAGPGPFPINLPINRGFKQTPEQRILGAASRKPRLSEREKLMSPPQRAINHMGIKTRRRRVLTVRHLLPEATQRILILRVMTMTSMTKNTMKRMMSHLWRSSLLSERSSKRASR